MMGRPWIVALVASLCLTGSVRAQQLVQTRQVFRSDSLSLATAQASPDGRWVVLVVEEGGGSSLFLARTDGGAPIRLTSRGFVDNAPRWFATGDRISFESTRPNRNGGRSSYLMVLAIDPASGTAQGAPRQVSIEPVLRSGRPSPDGQWLAYISAESPARLKVVPTNGGRARELTPVQGTVIAMPFAPDSRHVFLHERSDSQPAFHLAIRRVSIDDGSHEVVASADHTVLILAADPRFALHQVAPPGLPRSWEIRRLADQALVATANFPAGMRTSEVTGDGFGFMGFVGAWKSSVNVVPIDGGQPRVLASGDQHWPEGWLADGSAVITDRNAGDAIIVETLPLNGGPSRAARIPATAAQSGWQSSIGAWHSYRMLQRSEGTTIVEDALFVVNALTGETRELAPSTIRISMSGRGGLEQDGDTWIFATRSAPGGPLDLFSVDPARGTPTLLRRLPAELQPGPATHMAVHGRRIAWLTPRGDSVDLMLLDADAERPRRLATLSHDADVVRWSWDGTRLAVADWLPGTPRRGGVWIVTPGTDERAAPAIRSHDLGVGNGCDGYVWTPDDAQILMLCYGDVGRIMKLRLSDGSLSAVTQSEVPQEVWEFYLSPDGRHVAYPVQSNAGSSVYIADLRPLLR